MLRNLVVLLPEMIAGMKADLEQKLTSYGISGEIAISEMCDKHQYRDDMIVHPLTCIRIAAVLSDEGIDSALISVNGSEIQEIPYGSKIRDFCKITRALRVGNHFYGPAIGETVLDESFPVENGVFETIDDSDCIVNKAKEVVHALRKKSCGKCVFCREGLVQVDEILNDLMSNRSSKRDIELMHEIDSIMSTQSNCSLGKSAAGVTIGFATDFAEDV